VGSRSNRLTTSITIDALLILNTAQQEEGDGRACDGQQVGEGPVNGLDDQPLSVGANAVTAMAITIIRPCAPPRSAS
jgi:hypothetical protein